MKTNPDDPTFTLFVRAHTEADGSTYFCNEDQTTRFAAAVSIMAGFAADSYTYSIDPDQLARRALSWVDALIAAGKEEQS